MTVRALGADSWRMRWRHQLAFFSQEIDEARCFKEETCRQKYHRASDQR